MTNRELIQYYVRLLIIQYRGKPNAEAFMRAAIEPFIMDSIPFSVRDAYNIDTAVGVQLDILGKYAGLSRLVKTFTGKVSLGDDEYRILLKMKLIKNISGSSVAVIDSLLWTYFQNVLQLFDYGDMRIGYFFNASVGSQTLAEAFVEQDLLPRPMGVQLGALIYVPNSTDMFGWGGYAFSPPGVTGFNNYASYSETWHWLNYSDTITIS